MKPYVDRMKQAVQNGNVAIRRQNMKIEVLRQQRRAAYMSVQKLRSALLIVSGHVALLGSKDDAVTAEVLQIAEQALDASG